MFCATVKIRNQRARLLWLKIILIGLIQNLNWILVCINRISFNQLKDFDIFAVFRIAIWVFYFLLCSVLRKDIIPFIISSFLPSFSGFHPPPTAKLSTKFV